IVPRSVSFTRSPRQIYGREQDEYVGLDECNSDMQSDKDDRYRDRDERNENQNDHVTRKHVSVQTNRERQYSGEMADDLQRKHQERKCSASNPMHALHLRACEMRNVLKAGLSEAVCLIVDEHAERAAERDDVASGRGFESRDQAPQIRNQNKQTQCHQKWREPLAVMTDNLSALSLDESV